MAMATKVCEKCEASFALNTSPANIKKRKYCSRKCTADAFRDAVPSWEVAMRTRLAERQIVRDNGCIDYTGQSWGVYGQLEYRRVTYLAHRAAWQLQHGEIAKGLMVCHSCDNPKCINIDHLFIGTGKDNTRDMITKGRARYAPRRKLSNEQISEIRSALFAKEKHRIIAGRFNISQSMVSMIKWGRRHSSNSKTTL